MIIAAAQTKPKAQNTEANIHDHLRLIDVAAQNKSQLIVFPEMSLTGYERELAEGLSFSEDDQRLNVFKHRSALHQMLIIVGAPVKINAKLYIGAFIFSPDGSTAVYTKRFLHTGEEQFFEPGFDLNPLINFENEKISIAICADITNPLHAENAGKRNSTLYAAGIFYTPKSIAQSHELLSSYAKKYSMNVLMANYSGPSYNFDGAGQSAFWNNKGELVSKLESDAEDLLIAELIN
jgi:predicted amidohydrolase